MSEETLNGRRILGVFAHPDDETYGLGGSFLRYVPQGCAGTILTFTRGEAGEIAAGTGATPESLGEVREQELRTACKLFGVEDVRIVGTPDGGTVADDEGVARIEAALRELRPDVLVTMEPGGITNHPDHVAVSAMVHSAFERVREDGFPQKFYLTALPAAAIAALFQVLEERGTPLWSTDDPLLPQGSPDQSIACIVDVTSDIDAKVRALRAHATQVDGFLGRLPEDLYVMTLGAEAFQRVHPPRAPGEPVETDLFAGIR